MNKAQAVDISHILSATWDRHPEHREWLAADHPTIADIASTPMADEEYCVKTH
ncbi:MAG: hypothetical protein ACU84J_12180 [Gammaproteobacteria bacterium]